MRDRGKRRCARPVRGPEGLDHRSEMYKRHAVPPCLNPRLYFCLSRFCEMIACCAQFGRSCARDALGRRPLHDVDGVRRDAGQVAQPYCTEPFCPQQISGEARLGAPEGGISPL